MLWAASTWRATGPAATTYPPRVWVHLAADGSRAHGPRLRMRLVHPSHPLVASQQAPQQVASQVSQPGVVPQPYPRPGGAVAPALPRYDPVRAMQAAAKPGHALMPPQYAPVGAMQPAPKTGDTGAAAGPGALAGLWGAAGALQGAPPGFGSQGVVVQAASQAGARGVRGLGMEHGGDADMADGGCGWEPVSPDRPPQLSLVEQPDPLSSNQALHRVFDSGKWGDSRGVMLQLRRVRERVAKYEARLAALGSRSVLRDRWQHKLQLLSRRQRALYAVAIDRV